MALLKLHARQPLVQFWQDKVAGFKNVPRGHYLQMPESQSN